jgi:hypothetical protein
MQRTVRILFMSAAFLMAGALLAIAQSQPPEPAQKVVDAAVAKAKAENKAVFVHFSASW